MSSLANKVIEDILRVHVRPLLKDQGYVRRGRVWNKRLDQVGYAVQVQASQWNEGERGSFTVNLGVFVPYVLSVCPIPRHTILIEPAECSIETRIGLIGPGGTFLEDKSGRDVWWDVEAHSDLGKVGQSVQEAIANRAIPFLNRFVSLCDVAEFTLAHSGLMLTPPMELLHKAIILNKLGKHTEAYTALEQLKRKFPYWQDVAEATEQRLRETDGGPIGGS